MTARWSKGTTVEVINRHSKYRGAVGAIEDRQDNGAGSTYRVDLRHLGVKHTWFGYREIRPVMVVAP